MTLTKTASGYVGLFRRKGVKPLHLSMRTTSAREARTRYQAMRRAWRVADPAFIDQVRLGVIPIDRVVAIDAANEAFAPLAVATVEVLSSPRSPWLTVDQESTRYVQWMTVHPNKRERTTILAGAQLKRFRDFVYEGVRTGDRNLDDVTGALVQAYQRAMIEADTPPNTITTYMARVGALWRWVASQEQRDAREQRRDARALYSPVDAELMVREVHRRDRVLTSEEVERLWASTPAPMRWVVGCGLLAGLRIGEALHLRPGLDVDLEVGTLTVRDQPDWKTKTKRSKRLVPMAPALLEIAKEHVAAYASASWMMPSPVYADRPLSELAFRKYFIPVVERAGLVYGRGHRHGVVFHTLRHTFASHAVMRGVDLYTVAKLLGDSLKMVESCYADLSPDFKRNAVKKLAGAFAFASQMIQPAIQEPTNEAN